ncbi:NAD(P)-dependent oxidoreductase [Amphritea sp. 2_MG-2023]|jgi:nucleoside-diphosphate-sugar epimerase|uniref:NAD-dependent epimerase/dehydratase family protein n=1 Tax=Amphritea TaxID=515417 RepID=UPI001C06A837|nr:MULTISPECIES: NAD(P)-dependent oxidoreductase [Amphritea]MBU2965839.1 NAD(P)-dependent oxidoreductase [Amphritea atlantica]MDO6417395.1 NAD(P)-dependent oxidoreductase [Amphritea sp. 2_MG-2023]
MSIKRVVVTGGAGRVGGYVVRQLLKSYEVVIADLVAGESGVEYIEANVMDLPQLRKAFEGADAVVHLAALDYDWNCAPEKYIDVNVRGTWHVLQAASEANVQKVVLCSSVSACGLSEMRPNWKPTHLPIDETHENKPVEAYSVSKIVMEQMAKSFVDGTDMDVICLRPLAVVLDETLEEYIAFVDTPDRNWLFYYVTAEDVATAFDCALKAEELRFGTFFLSADDTSHPEPTLDWYRKIIGEQPEIIIPRRFQVNPRASVFSSAAAKEVLGWQPTSNFEQLRAKAKARA